MENEEDEELGSDSCDDWSDDIQPWYPGNSFNICFKFEKGILQKDNYIRTKQEYCSEKDARNLTMLMILKCFLQVFVIVCS